MIAYLILKHKVGVDPGYGDRQIDYLLSLTCESFTSASPDNDISTLMYNFLGCICSAFGVKTHVRPARRHGWHHTAYDSESGSMSCMLGRHPQGF